MIWGVASAERYEHSNERSIARKQVRQAGSCEENGWLVNSGGTVGGWGNWVVGKAAGGRV
eukprot:scaffold31103_cov54-Phaeocystis_antarctica.AAC.2